MSSSITTEFKENFKFVYNKDNVLKKVQYKPTYDIQLDTIDERFTDLISNINHGNIKTFIPLTHSEGSIINTNGVVLQNIKQGDVRDINCTTDNNGNLFIEMPIQFEIYHHNYISNYHRSGWDFVLSALSLYQIKNKSKPYIIFDPYMDETFLSHRNCTSSPYKLLQDNMNECKGWIGILHHPPITNSFTDYPTNFDANKVVNNTSFQIALKTCKGIIVFSDHLKRWLQKKLNIFRFDSIPIQVLYHPTEIVPTDKMFNPISFLNASPMDRYIVQIGGWLRNSYSIYELSIDNKKIQKGALKGPSMDIYFKPHCLDFKSISELCLYNDFVMQIDSNYRSVCNSSGLINSSTSSGTINLPNFNASGLRILGLELSGLDLSGLNLSELKLSGSDLLGLNISGLSTELNLSRLNLSRLNLSRLNLSELSLSRLNISGIQNDILNASKAGTFEPNKYIIGMIKCLESNDKSVKIFDYLNNDDYDNCLKKNIVFLNLIDASACNTILECIVRCTPIIINKIDPVVEYLGEEYPLYYTNIAEAVKLIYDLLDPKTGLLYKTIIYLTNINLNNGKLHIKTFLTSLNKMLSEINIFTDN